MTFISLFALLFICAQTYGSFILNPINRFDDDNTLMINPGDRYVSVTFAASGESPSINTMDLIIVPTLLPSFKSFERAAALMKDVKALKSGGWVSYLPKSGKCLTRATFWDIRIWSQTPLCPRKQSLWTRFLKWMTRSMSRFNIRPVTHPVWKRRAIDQVVPRSEWLPTLQTEQDNSGNTYFHAKIDAKFFRFHPNDKYHNAFRVLLVSKWRRRVFAINTLYITFQNKVTDVAPSFTSNDMRLLQVTQTKTKTWFQVPIPSNIYALFTGKDLSFQLVTRDKNAVVIRYTENHSSMNYVGYVKISNRTPVNSVLNEVEVHHWISHEQNGKKDKMVHEDGYRAKFFENIMEKVLLEQEIDVIVQDGYLKLMFNINSPSCAGSCRLDSSANFQKIIDFAKSETFQRWINQVDIVALEHSATFSWIMDLPKKTQQLIGKVLKLPLIILENDSNLIYELRKSGPFTFLIRFGASVFPDNAMKNWEYELSELDNDISAMDQADRLQIFLEVVNDPEIQGKARHVVINYLLELLGHQDVLSLLQKNDIDITKMMSKKDVLLPYIAGLNDLNLLDYVLSDDAALLSTQARESGQTLLHYATKYSATQVIKYLISRGANVEAEDNLKRIPAHYTNDLETLSKFRRSGPNIDVEDQFSLTPLSTIFFQSGTKHGENLLLVENRDDRTDYLISTLIKRAKLYNMSGMEKALLQHVRHDPYKAWYFALTTENEELVNDLLRNSQTEVLESVFINAASFGKVKIVEMLLNNGVDPSTRNNDAIIKASMHGYGDIVKLLLKDRRVDPSARQSEALRAAVLFSEDDIVRLLLEDGRADPRAQKMRFFRRPYRTAYSRDCEILNLFLQDGRVDSEILYDHEKIVAKLLQNSRVDPRRHLSCKII